jgi:DNA-binding transcriptional regulator YiaG
MEKKKNEWNKVRIKALRSHLELTQAEMAEEMGTRQQTISEWEVGIYEPRGASAKLLTMIAERSGFRYGVEENATGKKDDDSK